MKKKVIQVILLENVANLGRLGDVVDVASGYARNFLIPYGKAKRACADSLAEFAQKRAEYESLQNEILAMAQHRRDKLDGQVFAIPAKAGVDGKLFGSVTSLDIVAAVNAFGVEIKRSEVTLPHGPLKTTGEFDITIILHHDVHAAIKINVVPEQ